MDTPDVAHIAKGLARLFPDLGPAQPVRLLGTGFSSIVVEVAGARVFRVGKHAAAPPGHAREVRLLPELRDWLATPVPEPKWYAGPCAEFPFGVIGYPKLEGEPLTPDLLPQTDLRRLAMEVAGFLVALHGFPPDRAQELGVPGQDARWADLVALRDEELPLLRDVLTAGEHRTVARWWDGFLTDAELRRHAPRLLHGDLWYENILVDAARSVVGVLDFADASVGDPAQDFATLRHLDEPFMEHVLDAYTAAGGLLGDNIQHRVRRYWELREFGGVRYAVRFDPTELEDAVRKLRNGPVLSQPPERRRPPDCTVSKFRTRDQAGAGLAQP